jgi:magnesium-transporting ATPase (P-type)
MMKVYAGIVVLQIANVFNCRSEKHSAFRLRIFSNRRIFRGIAISLAFICILVYVPVFQKIFNTTALGWKEWGILFIFTLIIFFLEEMGKALSKNMRLLNEQCRMQ